MSKVVKRLLAILFILQLISTTPVHARRPGKGGCDEPYVVEEVETLQTISVFIRQTFASVCVLLSVSCKWIILEGLKCQ